jgi:hypothetical protein
MRKKRHRGNHLSLYNHVSCIRGSCYYRTHLWNAIVARILQCEDDKHQQCAGDKLREELTGLCKKSLRICAEYGRRCLWRRRYSPKTTFEVIDRRYVIGVHNAASDKPTKDLGDEVDREPSPWKLSKETVSQGDGWVQICARVACDIYT